MKIHGTKLFLDAMHDATHKKGEEEPVDFFAEHTNGDNFGFDAPAHPIITPTPTPTITASGSTSLAHVSFFFTFYYLISHLIGT